MTRDPYDSEQYRRTAQRQIKVGLLADRDYTARQIATELSVHINTVRRDLDDIGMTAARERRKAACGTPSGYKAHRRRHEPACIACRDAVNAADRRRRAARTAKEAVTQ